MIGKIRIYLMSVLLIMAAEQCFGDDTVKLAQPFVVSGVIINNGNVSLIKRFVNYLSKKTDYPLRVVYVDAYAKLSKVLRENPNAVGWTCGAPYVQDSKSSGQKLVAVPLFDKKPTYFSLVLTQKTRNEKKLADFKDGVLAFSDPRSNSGFLAPKYALHKQGIDMSHHFSLMLNAKNHEGSIEALLAGLADVAAVDEYIWVAYAKIHPGAKQILHEIERMGPYPFTPIVTGNEVSDEDIIKFSKVLINMRKDGVGRGLLAEFQLDGFVKKTPEFYEPIREMLKEVYIKPGD